MLLLVLYFVFVVVKKSQRAVKLVLTYVDADANSKLQTCAEQFYEPN